MTPYPYSEDHLVEQPALALLEELEWNIACGLEETFAPEGRSPATSCAISSAAASWARRW